MSRTATAGATVRRDVQRDEQIDERVRPGIGLDLGVDTERGEVTPRRGLLAIEHAQHPRPRACTSATNACVSAGQRWLAIEHVVRLLERDAGFDDDLTDPRATVVGEVAMELLHPLLGREDERDFGLSHRSTPSNHLPSPGRPARVVRRRPRRTHQRHGAALERRGKPHRAVGFDRDGERDVFRRAERPASATVDREHFDAGHDVAGVRAVLTHREDVDPITRGRARRPTHAHAGSGSSSSERQHPPSDDCTASRVTSEPFAIDAVATRPSSASRSSGPYSEAMTARSASMRAVRTESAAITVPGTTSSAATKTARGVVGRTQYRQRQHDAQQAGDEHHDVTRRQPTHHAATRPPRRESLLRPHLPHPSPSWRRAWQQIPSARSEPTRARHDA